MRVAGALVVVAAAGCGSKPAVEEPVANAREVALVRPSAYVAPRRAAPRPELDVPSYVPDFHEELRWPLTGMSHPVLEPRFPIARELAIDVDWQTLCARGVQNRTSATQKELLAYLHGWCDVLKRDVDAACSYLVPLLDASTRGIRLAVRQDLANILVDQGDADRAEHWLSKHHIDDIEVLDLLAASFVEVGSADDAFAINRRVIDIDASPSASTRCYRLVRRIVLDREAESVAPLELEAVATKSKVPDPTCRRMWSKVACWRDSQQCDAYFGDEHISQQDRRLVDVYRRWPNEGLWSDWFRYADDARYALPAPGAAELVITALETGLAARGDCPPYVATSVHRDIKWVRRFRHDDYEARLQALEQACPSSELPPGTAAPAQPASPVQPASLTP